MLVKPQIESLLPHVENRYSLAILVAKRARQLVDGGQPMCDSDSPNNVSIACQELYEDRIVCCLLYTSPSPRDGLLSRMPSSA